MGGVLQGWDVALEREVALKIISYELSSKEQFREMFIKEARVVSRLNHPNIAHIYHIGSCNDILYYAMEFVEGVTLKSLIFQKGPLTPLRGLDFLSIICNAFETVFQNSIVHRDVKPANIMISRNGGLKIVDFGVAQNVDMKTKGADRKNVMGSPLYMSPEQIAGLVIDHRSDMYSLGVTFYHALSGSPPFNADRIKDILNQHLNSPIPPLSNKKPNIPQDLSRIIEKMMAKDPGDRYDRFNDIVSDLKQLRPRMSKQSTPKAL
jgi:serine/threonine-protein kinase